MQTHYVHCKAGSYYRVRTTVQRGSMQLKWKTLNPTCRVTEFMCRLWCVCVRVCVCSRSKYLLIQSLTVMMVSF